MALDDDQLQKILEAALLVAGRPMNLNQIDNLFVHEAKEDKPARDDIEAALETLKAHYEDRGIELAEVASGYRIQARSEFAPWITNLFQEKAPRYSRALLETLVLIAYRQPITRGEVEDVRGVAVSTNIVKTLLEREWIKVLGHRDVPGRPALYGTTRQFLDYFNLKRIDELPTLSEIKDLDQIAPDLAREMALLESVEAEGEGDEASEVASDELDAETEIAAGNEAAAEAATDMAADLESGTEASPDAATDNEAAWEETTLANADPINADPINADQEDADTLAADSQPAEEIAEAAEATDHLMAEPLDTDSDLIDFDLGDETDELHATGSHQPEQQHSDTVH